MNFYSILFDRAIDIQKIDSHQAPAFFVDLNLDQIIDAITAGKKEYNLKPFFYTPLQDGGAIHYRHEILKDLENETLMEAVRSFAHKMIIMRRYLALVEKLSFKNHIEGWFLEAAEVYCEAVTGLARDLSHDNVTSDGLLAFREYITGYVDSDGFTSLLADMEELVAALSTVRYCVIIKDSTVRVRKYEEETDYSLEVQNTFEKFKQGSVKDYRVQLYKGTGMNHIEAQILDCVSRLYPDIFTSLDRFCSRYSHFLNETICAFDREIQFYVAFLEYAARIKRAGLKFCYPLVSTREKEIYNVGGYDLALADKRISEKSPIVCNDFYLKGEERIFVVSGPNQGGKTTFARTFGQLHYLASLGCPVPGREAQLFLYDRIFTHFEKEEDIRNLRGKLQDDLVRGYAILAEATPNSVIIMNEIFTSTTVQDAVFLSKKILEKVVELDLLCVWVTFVDELASFNEKTVSMVSTVVPDNPALRTFKLVRKPADGLAYAVSIAEKYRLTYDHLKERIES